MRVYSIYRIYRISIYVIQSIKLQYCLGNGWSAPNDLFLFTLSGNTNPSDKILSSLSPSMCCTATGFTLTATSLNQTNEQN